MWYWTIPFDATKGTMEKYPSFCGRHLKNRKSTRTVFTSTCLQYRKLITFTLWILSEIWRRRRSNFQSPEATNLTLAGFLTAWNSTHFWSADDPIDCPVHLQFELADPTTWASMGAVVGGLSACKRPPRTTPTGASRWNKVRVTSSWVGRSP